MNHLAEPLQRIPHKAKQPPALGALKLADRIVAEIARLEAHTKSWRDVEGNSKQETAFLEGLPVEEIRAATAALWAALDAVPDPGKTIALLSIAIDAIPAATKLDVETFLPVALAMIEREPVETLDPIVGGKCRSIELRGFSPAIVSLAVQQMLRNQKFAPAISEVLAACRGARFQAWRAAIAAERLLAERERVLNEKRRLAEIERTFAGRDRKDLIAELRNAPSAPNPFAERARRIQAEERERWRKITAGELNPFADLCEGA